MDTSILVQSMLLMTLQLQKHEMRQAFKFKFSSTHGHALIRWQSPWQTSTSMTVDSSAGWCFTKECSKNGHQTGDIDQHSRLQNSELAQSVVVLVGRL